MSSPEARARIAELARLGPAADGHEGPTPYQKESPPLSPEARAWLDTFPTVPRPASPGLVLLWDSGRLVFVGKSIHGLFGSTLPAYRTGECSRAGTKAKRFDRVSFMALPEELLDLAIGALVRMFKPRDCHHHQRGFGDPSRDQDVLALLGFSPVRAA